ncbi:glycosyltransferase [Haloplanus litoreus]|uniref:glycosyltransferase n=1 Tax=Haloplanus litoreus TaxID=767515 RepID=UPI0036197C95
MVLRLRGRRRRPQRVDGGTPRRRGGRLDAGDGHPERHRHRAVPAGRLRGVPRPARPGRRGDAARLHRPARLREAPGGRRRRRNGARRDGRLRRRRPGTRRPRSPRDRTRGRRPLPRLPRPRGAPAFYSALDAFVFPSPIETQGLVALEANACGTPVVGANDGALADTVVEGETGYHFETGDVKSLRGRFGGRWPSVRRSGRRVSLTGTDTASTDRSTASLTSTTA